MMKKYTLPAKEINPVAKRVLSFDPGSTNMGVTCLEYDEATQQFKVLADAVLMHPLHDLKKFTEGRDAFLAEVNSWIYQYDPQAIIAERFQSRGLRGTTIECVCIMLGLLASLQLPVLFITAATWKNRYQKRFNIDLREIYKEIQVAPHQLDSCLIGCYGIEVGLKQTISFNIDDIIAQVSDESLVPLKVRRGKIILDEDE